MDLLVRAYDPDRGAVLLDGVDIRRLPLAELRRAIGFVPQETFLFSETLRENVLLGAPDDGRLERLRLSPVRGANRFERVAEELPDHLKPRVGNREPGGFDAVAELGGQLGAASQKRYPA